MAIARALTMEPRVLLFDEPTSALDPTLVGEVLTVMEDLAHEGATMIVVTHEMAFAREAADRVYYIDEGVFVEVGPPEQVINNPKDGRTREFLARTLGEAHVHEGGAIHEPSGAGAVHIHAEGAAHGFDTPHEGDLAQEHDEDIVPVHLHDEDHPMHTHEDEDDLPDIGLPEGDEPMQHDH